MPGKTQDSSPILALFKLPLCALCTKDCSLPTPVMRWVLQSLMLALYTRPQRKGDYTTSSACMQWRFRETLTDR